MSTKNTILGSINTSTLKSAIISEVGANGRIMNNDFIVVTVIENAVSDWVSRKRILEIIALDVADVGNTGVEYLLKNAMKGNLDEGRDPKEGKAIKLYTKDTFKIIEVYTQNYGEAWKLSHTHKVALKLYEAYMTVVVNDDKVMRAEKESKSIENFSLGLN